MEYFDMPQFNENIPCDKLPFWECLTKTYGAGKFDWPTNLSFIDAFTAYLVSLGFNKESDRVSRETGNVYIEVHALMYVNKVWRIPHSYSDTFTDSEILNDKLLSQKTEITCTIIKG